MLKKITALLLAVSIVASQSAVGAFADGYSESKLKSLVKAKTTYDLKDWLYDDFDANGTKEAFAFFTNENGPTYGSTKVYFVNSNGKITEILENYIPYWGKAEKFQLDANKKAACFVRSNQGTIRNYLFGVNGNSCFEYNISKDNDYGVIEKQKAYNYDWIIYDAEGGFRQIGRESYKFDADKNTFSLYGLSGQVFDGWGAYTNIYANNELLITSYRFDPGETFTIPSEIGGLDVHYLSTQFYFKNFYLNDDITDYFEYGKSVKKLVLPSKLKGLFHEAGTGCFNVFANLKEFEIASSNKYFAVKDGILYSKDMKTLYAYPAGKISSTLKIPEGVENLGTKGDLSPFTESNKIKKVIFPSTLKNISAYCAFSDSSVEEIVFPEGLEYIGAEAFRGCKKLKEVTIPKSVKTIEDFAFGSNTKKFWGVLQKTDITIKGYTGSAAEKYAVENGIKFVSLNGGANHEQEEVPVDYSKIFNCETKNDGTIKITKYIGSDSELNIPSEIDGRSVSEVGENIFDYFVGGNRTVKKLTIPKSVKTLGEAAFAGGYELEEVYIEEGLKTIGGAAFGSCQKLKKITIPASVESMGNVVFCAAYASDSPASIDVTIYCKKDSKAYKYACGDNIMKHVFKVKLIGDTSTSTKPAVPTAKKYTSTTNAVRINWNKADNASGYRVYQYDSASKKWNAVKTVSANTLTYKVSGLEAGATYKFKVKAYNKSGGKTVWGSASATITTATKPSKPTISKASKSKTAVRLYWNKVAGASGYKIQQYDNAAKKWKTVKVLNATNYKVTGLQSGTAYKFRIQAYKNAGGQKSYSDWSSTKKATTK